MPPFSFLALGRAIWSYHSRDELSLRDSIAIRAHLEGFSFDDVILKFNAFYCGFHLLLMLSF